MSLVTILYAPVAQRMRALRFGRRGRGFKSLQAYSMSFGTHVLSISKFSELLKNTEDFTNIFYTSDELKYCNNRLSSLAGRYAAKIAIKKILPKKIGWKEMSILSLESRQPIVITQEHLEVSLSITHDEDVAAAFAAYVPDKHIQVGLDVTSTSRIAKLKVKKVFADVMTSDEWDDAFQDIQKLAEKWTGKEAVLKALGIGICQGVALRDIEILTENNRSVIKLKNGASQLAEKKSLHTWKISFTHVNESTFAFVVAE
jgi:holo-[acyl-carrier protein] synthase